MGHFPKVLSTAGAAPGVVSATVATGAAAPAAPATGSALGIATPLATGSGAAGSAPPLGPVETARVNTAAGIQAVHTAINGPGELTPNIIATPPAGSATIASAPGSAPGVPLADPMPNVTPTSNVPMQHGVVNSQGHIDPAVTPSRVELPPVPQGAKGPPLNLQHGVTAWEMADGSGYVYRYPPNLAMKYLNQTDEAHFVWGHPDHKAARPTPHSREHWENGQEAISSPCCSSQEKLHTAVLKGVRNIPDAL